MCIFLSRLLPYFCQKTIERENEGKKQENIVDCISIDRTRFYFHLSLVKQWYHSIGNILLSINLENKKKKKINFVYLVRSMYTAYDR